MLIVLIISMLWFVLFSCFLLSSLVYLALVCCLVCCLVMGVVSVFVAEGGVCCVDFFGFVVLQLICDFLVFGFISLDLVVCCDFWFVALGLLFGLVCWVGGGCVCWCRFYVGGYCFDVVFGSVIVL